MFADIKFSELIDNQTIVNYVDKLGFTAPTIIQHRTYLPLLEGKDLLAQSRTGTGKTLAFSLPLLQRLDSKSSKIQLLVLSPTRELCLQIYNDLDKLSREMGLKMTAVYGGDSITRQISQIKRNPQIIIATPGRLVDLINRKNIVLNDIKSLVLDEADEMLDMGFYDDLNFILDKTPETRQTALFSATYPLQIKKIVQRYLKEPEIVQFDSELRANESIEHAAYLAYSKNRLKSLINLLLFEDPSKAILFCNTKNETAQIATSLSDEGFSVGFINGDLNQSQRTKILDSFRASKIQLLLATDVAARGIDIDDITHVIHLSLPQNDETYIHRSGRTGRAGKTGESILIISPSELRKFNEIKRNTKISFNERDIPQPEEISFIKKERFFDNLKNLDISDQDKKHFEKYAEELLQENSAIELTIKMLSLYSKDALGLKAGYSFENPQKMKSGSERRERSDGKNKKSDQRGSGRFTKYFINLGHNNKFNPKDLIQLINESQSGHIKVGKIDVYEKFSFFEVDPNTNFNLTKLTNMDYKGRKVICDLAKARK
jgi:ATP-dependent RNA helicase DeaD